MDTTDIRLRARYISLGQIWKVYGSINKSIILALSSTHFLIHSDLIYFE